MDNFFEDFISGTYFKQNILFERRLDETYMKDITAYYHTLNQAKSLGYKVYRNSEGKHKVKGEQL